MAIAGGRDHYLALKADGTVAARGDDRYGEADVPSGLSNVVAIAAGAYHSMAVKSDGSVVAWGAGKGGGFPRPGPPAPPNFGQSTVPTNLTDVAAIAAGGYNSLALVGDGPPVLTTPLVDRSVVAGATAYLRVAAVGAGDGRGANRLHRARGRSAIGVWRWPGAL